jgi:hypothetical protein
MKKLKPEFVVPGVLLSLTAMWLLSQPKCNRGCRTVAEHLLQHGIRDIILGV